MASKGLTEAWRGAEAAKPFPWMIRGVVPGPRDVDPAIRGPRWAARAREPHGARLLPEGESPHDALMALALRELET